MSPPADTELDYDVVAWSSYSAQYHPRNIKVNKPQEQSSRWSSASTSQSQYLLLKLDRMAIVRAVTHGKYAKSHVCTLKEFKMYAGLDRDDASMRLILHSGLRNDDEPETFPVLHTTPTGVAFPCRYVKIVPLAAYGANFNFSVWHLLLHGQSDPDSVSRAYDSYVQYREEEVVRLCLKHFRQRNYMEPFQALLQRTNVRLEHEALTELHTLTVVKGDFAGALALLERACTNGWFDEHIDNLKYKTKWTRIDAPGPSPQMRGGHQMLLDGETQRIFLFGGWDGQKDLADFWYYSLENREWVLVARNTEAVGGPCARSCHKVCLDTNNKRIYTLGRYVDQESRYSASLAGDFFYYDIVQNTWHLVSNDLVGEGGPGLIYDHQMVIDNSKGHIYVFGGRVIAMTSSENIYSGLYRYSIATNTWELLRSESSPQHGIQMRSRIGHSMLFNAVDRQLYVFAGQRNKDYLSDFYVFDIDSGTVVEMTRDSSRQGGPEAGFTQRATIDQAKMELYVLSGLMRDKSNSSDTIRNCFWVYKIRTKTWSQVYQNKPYDKGVWNQEHVDEPCPRFAHQLVYNAATGTHYLFGGNPGDSVMPKTRLDDFWSLDLSRPAPSAILRKAKFLVAQQQFREMCAKDSAAALEFLQTDIASLVDHDSPAEGEQFRALAQAIFAMDTADTGVWEPRTALFEELLDFFPASMKQPRGELIGFI